MLVTLRGHRLRSFLRLAIVTLVIGYIRYEWFAKMCSLVISKIFLPLEIFASIFPLQTEKLR